MIRWAAIVIASLGWLFAFDHFVEVDSARQWASFFTFPKGHDWGHDRYGQWTCILAGVMLLAIGFRGRIGAVRMSGGYWLLLFPIAIAWFVASGFAADAPAYRPPLAVLGCGVVALLVSSSAPPLGFLQPAGFSASALGAILVLQSPLYWLCSSWTARTPDVPYVAYVPYLFLKWIGSDVSYSDHTLYVRLMRDTHPFPLTWEHLGILPVLAIFVGGAAVLWWDRQRRPFGAAMAKLSLTLIFFVFLRLCIMLAVYITAMIYVEHESDVVHVEVFWLPWITAVSFLLVIPFLSRWLPWEADAPPIVVSADGWDRPVRRAASAALLCLAAVAMVVHVHFWDPGTPKRGRVLLDEAHNRWERTDKPYNTDWYGHESGYNYYCMAQFLRHYYELDFNMEGELTAEKLSNYDVLILKTPTAKYSEEEIDAIEGFVRGGGGLFALGEHTNVFGSSSYLNPVVRRFGMAFRYDSVFDIERKWEQVYFPPKRSRHPIMNDVPFFRFAVSCSIASNSWDARPVIRSNGLWSLPISYAAGNFYPSVEDRSDAKFGAFNQMVCAAVGAGRVVSFGDSTVYSNFLAFYPGKAEVLLGAVDWLNRVNRWDGVNRLALGVFAAALLLGLLLQWRLSAHFGPTLMTVSTAAALVWTATWALDMQTRIAFQRPKPHTPVPRIVFEMQHGDYELPVFSFTKDYPRSYEVFYQYVLRVGYYPDVSFDLRRSMASSDDPIVVIRPHKAFSNQTIDAAREFVERGGTLLVLDSTMNRESTADELLRPFGLGFSPGPTRGVFVVEPASGARICGLQSGRAVEGGTALMRTEAGEAILAYARLGRGRVIAAGLADRFTNVQMGGSDKVIPTPQFRAAYELQFQLLRGLIEGDMEKAMRELGRTYAPAAEKPTGGAPGG